MSFSTIVGGTLRTLLIAGATAAAAFGLLVVFQPFGKAPVATMSTAVSGTPAANALQGRIEALRLALRETEMALDNVKSEVPATPAADATRTQYEAQIAAATERRDLALRHAAAIRQGLEAGITVSSLAQIRDSVVIGQLLSHQAALDTQIAIDGARFKANHPTMRALTAQRASLLTQIRQEAANIASALEAEAKMDDAQIELLQSQLPPETAQVAVADSSALEAKAGAQRAELDGLVDAYFNIPPATTTSSSAPAADPLSTMNLLVVGVAGAAAVLFQIVMLSRRRRAAREAADEAAWAADHDPEIILVEEPEPLRKAS